MMAMSPLAQGTEALALAASFALLGTWRPRRLIVLCAIQAGAVGIAALAQSLGVFAAVALAEAALLTGAAWQWRGLPGTVPFPPPALSPGRIAAAGVLAVMATATPAGGIGLAIVLLGLLLLSEASPQRQALGIIALQSGLLLAGITRGLSGWQAVPVAVPLLPAAAIIGLWLPHRRGRAIRAELFPAAGQVEAALCGVGLVAAGALPRVLDRGLPFWSIDARTVHIVLLLAALATAAGWRDRHAVPVPGSRLAILAGTAFAVLSGSTLASWLGMALAALSAASVVLPRRPLAWRRLMLAAAGLALALCGTVSLHAQPSVPAAGLLLLGYGSVAVLAPELAVAAVALALRIPGGIGGSVLLPAGLAALLLAAGGLALGGGQQDRLGLVDLAQGGVALFAFGLGTPAGHLAGLLQLTLLALTRCATRLAAPGGLDQAAATAGLAGVPPFGLFASLALILAATAAQAAWLLLPLGAGLAMIAWTLLSRLSARAAPTASPAWLPLALTLLLGLAMPGPLLAWFRLAAR